MRTEEMLRTNAKFWRERRDYHSDIRIDTEARLADDREIRASPAISVLVSQYSIRLFLNPHPSSSIPSSS
ncbi:hypothetical protein F2Q68_00024892 [Brassica cretica]|uniref:Uncharacterized protein n=1 Tax=Brassica cretica TaxID=69181 RepID=A0A8S9ICG0_BRACR|nr:hypothetical protein F2Q68_00024892 [Brassica cretica]